MSGNGNWEGFYDFYATHLTFTMTRMTAGRAYWVLYEGTPGGTFDSGDYWMTSAISTKSSSNFAADIPSPEWIAFGDQNLDRVLFLLHHEDDGKTDYYHPQQTG